MGSRLRRRRIEWWPERVVRLRALIAGDRTLQAQRVILRMVEKEPAEALAPKDGEDG